MGLVSQYGGLEQLGYLRVAQSMAALIGFIPSAIAPAAISYLSASAADDKQSYQYLKSVHLRGVWILLLIPTGLVSLILPDLINLLFGSDYKQAIILSWLSLWISALYGVASVLVQYLVVAGKTVEVSYASLVGVTSWVLSAFLLVPRYSSLGFLISQFIGQLAGFICIIKPSLGDLAKTDIFLLIKLMVISEIFFMYTLLVSVFLISHPNNYLLFIITIPLICISTFTSVFHTTEKLRIRKILLLKR
jgi:O-antigen/teichoic acid export membrane protein